VRMYGPLWDCWLTMQWLVKSGVPCSLRLGALPGPAMDVADLHAVFA